MHITAMITNPKTAAPPTATPTNRPTLVLF